MDNLEELRKEYEKLDKEHHQLVADNGIRTKFVAELSVALKNHNQKIEEQSHKMIELTQRALIVKKQLEEHAIDTAKIVEAATEAPQALTASEANDG